MLRVAGSACKLPFSVRATHTRPGWVEAHCVTAGGFRATARQLPPPVTQPQLRREDHVGSGWRVLDLHMKAEFGQ